MADRSGFSGHLSPRRHAFETVFTTRFAARFLMALGTLVLAPVPAVRPLVAPSGRFLRPPSALYLLHLHPLVRSTFCWAVRAAARLNPPDGLGAIGASLSICALCF
jgi:hypothetical protein